MSESTTLVFPADSGPVDLSIDHYNRLIRVGLTRGQMTVLTAAAQIVAALRGSEFRDFAEIVTAIHGPEVTKPTMSEKRARMALVRAGIVVGEGNTNLARYRLATQAELAASSETGFSLIDVVVTVAIIIALSVGGFFAYNGLLDQAKQGAVDYAASNVYESIAAYEQDGLDSTSACSAIDEYNANSEGIKVTLTVPVGGDASAPGLVYVGPGEANTFTC